MQKCVTPQPSCVPVTDITQAEGEFLWFFDEIENIFEAFPDMGECVADRRKKLFCDVFYVLRTFTRIKTVCQRERIRQIIACEFFES